MRHEIQRALTVLSIIALLGCDAPAGAGDSGPSGSVLTLTSSAFAGGADIPREHTCEGSDRSVPLAWSGAPDGTRSFALIVHDVDGLDFVHWVLYDVPASASLLPAGVAAGETLADGSRQGRSDFGDVGWGGPCPPSDGPHTYVFTLYALDTVLELSGGPSAEQVRSAMQGRVLAQSELRGRYEIP